MFEYVTSYSVDHALYTSELCIKRSSYHLNNFCGRELTETGSKLKHTSFIGTSYLLSSYRWFVLLRRYRTVLVVRKYVHSRYEA